MSDTDDNILNEADWDAIFTQDPNKFIDNIALNLMHDTQPEQSILARQRLVFKKWLGFYSAKYRETIAQSVQNKYAHRYEDHIQTAKMQGFEDGRLFGRHETLANLPLKRGLFGMTVVDFKAINKELEQNAESTQDRLA